MPEDNIVEAYKAYANSAADATNGEPSGTADATPEIGAGVQPTEPETQSGEQAADTEPAGDKNTPEADDKAEATPDAGEQEKADTPDDTTRAMEDRIKALLASVRGLAKERNTLKAELAGKAGQSEPVTAAAEAAPTPEAGMPAPTDIGEYKDAGRFVDPIFKGMPYDPNDNTICVGNPDDPSDWVKPQIAAAYLQSLYYAEAQQRAAEQQQHQYQLQNLEQLRTEFETAEKNLRAKALPFVPEEHASKIDDLILSHAQRRMAEAGLTPDRIAAFEDQALETAANCLQESVADVRSIFEAISRTIQLTNDKAARDEPVPASGQAAVPLEKSAGEMTPEEHSKYVRNGLKDWLRRKS